MITSHTFYTIVFNDGPYYLVLASTIDDAIKIAREYRGNKYTITTAFDGCTVGPKLILVEHK